MDATTIPPLADYRAPRPAYRAAPGKQPPLAALLLPVCVAMRCGARGQRALAAWGRHHGPAWRRRRGCTTDRAPSRATRSRRFARLPHQAVAAAPGRWAEQVLRCCPAAPGAPGGIALDGTTRRGGTRHGAADAPLLAACRHRCGVVLGQVGVPDTTNAIGAAQAFLRAVALEGRIVTADALLTQRELAQTIVAGGGDDLLAVKGNQPTLRADSVAACAPAADGTGLVGTARTVPRPGPRLAYRTLTASTALVGDSAWPGRPRVLRRERRVRQKATGQRVRRETASAVTAAPPARATPPQRLVLWRQHWSSENRRHSIRDVAFDEDRATARAGHAPQVMAAFRNAASGLSHALGSTQVTATCRRFAAQPLAALHALGIQPHLE